MTTTVTDSDDLSTVVYEQRRVVDDVRRYKWPPLALNAWILVMLAAACTIIGIFSVFIQVQYQLDLPIPWYFPYYVTVASLVVAFILSMFWMIAQRRLFPAVVFVAAGILLVLWLVGLVVVGIELFGDSPSISQVCDVQVFNQDPHGRNIYTLAWLMQRNICQSWQAVFAFGLIGSIFLIWIMIMAYQVFADSS